MSKNIYILGAGYAGIEAALTLSKKIKKTDDINIHLIDRNTYHTLLTELHEVAGNRIPEDGIIVPLKDIFRYTNVNLIRDEIIDINFEKKLLISNQRNYNYDYLIISTGSQPNFYGIEGLKENSFTLWSYEDAVKIREHIKECFYKASNETNPDIRKSLLTFIIVGGGFSGVEMAGELALWSKKLCREYDINRNEIDIKIVEALPDILNNLHKKSTDKARRYLERKLKVDVLTDSAVVKVDPGTVSLKNGNVLRTNTLIWTAGIKASEINEHIAAKVKQSKGFRIEVDDYTGTQYENVYCAGDSAAFKTDKGLLPALVEGALQTGKTAALNILADIHGRNRIKLKPKLHGVMVSIGSYFAVSNIMGINLPNIPSIIMKYYVNMHYLFGIGGFELVIRYISHEFFEKRQDQMLAEKHLTVKKTIFWLVPLRIFLGYSWLQEGLAKLSENWLNTPLLAGKQPDLLSGASVTETGEKVFRIVSSHTPFWYEWIAENIVIPNALFFQAMIVLGEIAIGIALITGSFTFIAALAALALNINFILSTGLYPEDWWFIPAAIAMLSGAGRTFGADYYIMPYLMRQWRYFIRNKRIKLFLFR